MKISVLLLATVVVLNSVDRSLQGNFPSFNRPPSDRVESSGRGESSSRREPSPPPRRRFPDLPGGSHIIRGVKIPSADFVFKSDNKGHFGSFHLPVDAVVNYEGKIVGIFKNKYDHRLYPVCRNFGGRDRVKLNPACLDQGFEHFDYMDPVGDSHYPEFKRFEKPEAITVGSIKEFLEMGLAVACTHTIKALNKLDNFANGIHIVPNVQFPAGLFFKLNANKNSPRRSLEGHVCESVVDPFKNIVAIFLSESEHRLLGIYDGEEGGRVKLIHYSTEHQYVKIMNEETELNKYLEFMSYKKPREIYKESLEACG